MKCQHSIPPIKNWLNIFRIPRTKELIHVRRELHQHLKNNVSLSFVLSSAPELETTHWVSVHKVTSLFMHRQNTKSRWRKRVTEQRQPSLRRVLSHRRYSTRMSGIVLTCVCVCLCVGWQSCKWGSGGECVPLVDMCTQPFVLRVWTVSVMNLKRSAKQWGLCRWFPWLQKGGGGSRIHLKTATEKPCVLSLLEHTVITSERNWSY